MEYATAYLRDNCDDDNNNNGCRDGGGGSSSSICSVSIEEVDASSLSRAVSDLVISGYNDSEVDNASRKTHYSKRNEQREQPSHGKRQSPIDIDTRLTAQDSSMLPLALSYCRDEHARLVNDGKAPACYVIPGRHFLSGGPLRESYELVQYHIHFASQTSNHGSEHTVDGHGYPAEIHFVHYKSSYGDFSAALEHPDGLAVVGAFVDIDNNNRVVHEQLNADVLKMINIVEKGSAYATPVELEKYNVAKSEHFYHYSGSLTSEPYQECVEWILMREPLSISADAYEVLKKLQASYEETIFEKGNSRSTQDKNGRKVLCNLCMN